jgi:hypothetical protein
MEYGKLHFNSFFKDGRLHEVYGILPVLVLVCYILGYHALNRVKDFNPIAMATACRMHVARLKWTWVPAIFACLCLKRVHC